MTDEVTKSQVAQAIELMRIIGGAIKEAGADGIPSGVLYAAVMGVMSYDAYTGAIGLLKRTGLVTEQGFVLRWAGPK